MKRACAAVAALLLLVACGAQAQENTAGLAAFRELSLESVNLTEALYDAILAGNLAGPYGFDPHCYHQSLHMPICRH
jgi:hypothetical protein